MSKRSKTDTINRKKRNSDKLWRAGKGKKV